MQTILFFSRLGLYLFLICMPLWLKPAIVVAYDSVTIAAWLITLLVPILSSLPCLHFNRSEKITCCILHINFLGFSAPEILLFSIKQLLSFLFKLLYLVLATKNNIACFYYSCAFISPSEKHEIVTIGMNATNTNDEKNGLPLGDRDGD